MSLLIDFLKKSNINKKVNKKLNTLADKTIDANKRQNIAVNKKQITVANKAVKINNRL